MSQQNEQNKKQGEKEEDQNFDDSMPLMSQDETTQLFFEYARYNEVLTEDNDEKEQEKKTQKEKQQQQKTALELLQELLVKSPSLVDAQDLHSGRTALHFAAANGHDKIVELLVKSKAKVNAQSRESGFTPLHDAVVNNRAPTVVFLLSVGADPALKSFGQQQRSQTTIGAVTSAAASSASEKRDEINNNNTDDDGETPLELAEKLAFYDVASLLLKADKTVESYETEAGKITMDIEQNNQEEDEEGEKVSSSATAAASSSSLKKEETKPVDVNDVE